MKYLITFFACIICTITIAQSQTKRVLFLGNSYTYVNNLPQMIADMALSTGDSLFFDSNTPGGYTLQGHATNTTSLSKIALGNWDYVVLQEQSQLPSFPISQVLSDVFPFARFLDSTINSYNPCTETVFYMTWGRKNGDASNCATWPPVCTYSGMDSLLNMRYKIMADSNNAILSPVGAVWKYVKQNFPLIDLYQTDESHPSVAGTYAAACSFYAALFKKDPTSITFNSTLLAADAASIRDAAKFIVFDSLANWHVGEYDPLASYTFVNNSSMQVSFTNQSANATSFAWDFGDGTTSTNINPTHLYQTNGTYIVNLMASNCGLMDSTFQTINVTSVGIHSIGNKNLLVHLHPNPATAFITVKENTSGSFTYKIIGVCGEIIQSGFLNNTEKQIEVSSLLNGIYFLQLFDGNNFTVWQRFVKTAN